ncbi:hypothetical protein RUND412_001342 [Rhizina undulata]
MILENPKEGEPRGFLIDLDYYKDLNAIQSQQTEDERVGTPGHKAGVEMPDALQQWKEGDFSHPRGNFPMELAFRFENNVETAGCLKIAKLESADSFNRCLLQNFSPLMQSFELETLAEEWRKILFWRPYYDGIFKGTPTDEKGRESLYGDILDALERAISRELTRSRVDRPESAVN